MTDKDLEQAPHPSPAEDVGEAVERPPRPSKAEGERLDEPDLPPEIDRAVKRELAASGGSPRRRV